MLIDLKKELTDLDIRKEKIITLNLIKHLMKSIYIGVTEFS
jgi:hypothetical protein